MYIQTERGEGVVAYNVMNLTPDEMRTIVDMDKKIADTLISHHPEFKGNKIYLSDNDLFTLRGILYSFARYSNVHNSNAFNAMKAELRKKFESIHYSKSTEAPQFVEEDE